MAKSTKIRRASSTTDQEWQTGRIRLAISHFLGTNKKERTAPNSGYLSPSRFRNVCKRQSALMPDILKSLPPADRKVIEDILNTRGEQKR